MKKHRANIQPAGSIDEILPEYDFSRARPNKYAQRYRAGSLVVVLEPDVAAAFPSAAEANDALRALARIIQKHRLRGLVDSATPREAMHSGKARQSDRHA